VIKLPEPPKMQHIAGREFAFCLSRFSFDLLEYSERASLFFHHCLTAVALGLNEFVFAFSKKEAVKFALQRLS